MWTRRIKAKSESKYATTEDFRKLFTEGLDSLYLLAFLLTANQEKAEQCFVAGLDDCVEGNRVFHEWANAWVRRVIVRSAVRMVAPRSDGTSSASDAGHPVADGRHNGSDRDARFAKILALGDFERFVFVVSILEGYSELDCATVLGASRQKVREARIRAIEQIADYDVLTAKPKKDLQENRSRWHLVSQPLRCHPCS